MGKVPSHKHVFRPAGVVRAVRQAHRFHLAAEDIQRAGFNPIGIQDERDQLIVADAAEFEFAVFVRRHRRDELLKLAPRESTDVRGAECLTDLPLP